MIGKCVGNRDIYASRKKTRQLQFLFASTPTVDLGDGNIGISPLSMATSCAKKDKFNPLNRGVLQPRSAGRFETPLGLQMVGSLGDSSGLEGAMWSVPGGSIFPKHIPLQIGSCSELRIEYPTSFPSFPDGLLVG